MIQGQIIKVTGGLYTVIQQDGTLWVTKPRGVFRKTGETPYTGDVVDVDPDPEKGHTGTIVNIHQRKNFLIRPPVANLDLMVMVVSVKDPAPNFVTIDKYLAIMEAQNIPTILVITKPDLGDAAPLEKLYQSVGYTTFVVNNETGTGGKELKEFLTGKLSAFSGNTGTGKSSLINVLDPTLQLEVGETSKKLGRGRHTTRHVEIFTLESGLRIADTPGFSSLDIVQTTEISAEELDLYFIDFLEAREQCPFRDCAHLNETGCGVRHAVQEGTIVSSRYNSYQTIYEELKGVKEWERRS